MARETVRDQSWPHKLRKLLKPTTRLSTFVLNPQELKTQIDLLNGRTYKGYWDTQRSLRVLVHSTIGIFMSLDRADFQNGVKIKAEIKPPGETNPHAWAKKAKESDPATRLVFCVTLKRVDGEKDLVLYASSEGEISPAKANAFVDWMNGEPNVAIAKKPRRYSIILTHTVDVSEEMRPFIGGAYTDDNGRPCKLRPQLKRKALEEEGEDSDELSKRRRMASMEKPDARISKYQMLKDCALYPAVNYLQEFELGACNDLTW